MAAHRLQSGEAMRIIRTHTNHLTYKIRRSMNLYGNRWFLTEWEAKYGEVHRQDNCHAGP